MRKTTIQFLMLLLVLTLFSFSVSAASYWSKGSASQLTDYITGDASGVWPTTGAQYSRSGNYVGASVPLVHDLDDDGTNEIIILNNNTLEVLHYDTGAGLSLQASFSLGNTVHKGSTVDVDTEQTPAILVTPFDNDQIVAFNHTHMLLLRYNGTAININQTSPTLLSSGSNYVGVARHPVIKCATFSAFADGNNHCFMVVENRSTTSWLQLLDYDIQDNEVNATNISVVSTAPAMPEGYNIHVGDADGALSDYEVVFSYGISNNKIVTLCQVGNGGANTCTDISSENLGAAYESRSNDMVMNDIDGVFSNGLEITYLYDTGLGWEARTMDNLGVTIEDNYFVSNPSGDIPSTNGVAVLRSGVYDYCVSDYDVMFYLSDFDTLDGDKILCISQRYGSDTETTTVTDTQNLTSRFYFHQNKLFDGITAGLLTSKSGWDGNTEVELGLPSLDFVYTIDYQESGTADIIGVSDGTLFYYDDAYTNQNVDITSVGVDTGNSVCQNELVQFTVEVDDNEANPSLCALDERWANGTFISNTNTTWTANPATFVFNHHADLLGTFLLSFDCRDDFHSTNTTYNYAFVVSNNTATCKRKGEGATEVSEETIAEAAADEEFVENADDLFCSIGACSARAKAFVWLIVMILLGMAAGGVLYRAGLDGTSVFNSLVGFELLMVILGWLVGAISYIVLVVVALILIVMLAMIFFTRKMDG